MAKTTGNIILVGPMGAGKTTIGRQLARLSKRAFIDSDKEIEARTGAAISLIFELEGEAGFRKREKAMIDELTQREDTVIATGGGAVLDPENRAWMQARGFVIYLKASVDKLLERTGKDKGRPLLQTDNPRQTLLNILEARDAYYREVADAVIETNGCTARGAVRKILRLIPQKAD